MMQHKVLQNMFKNFITVCDFDDILLHSEARFLLRLLHNASQTAQGHEVMRLGHKIPHSNFYRIH